MNIRKTLIASAALLAACGGSGTIRDPDANSGQESEDSTRSDELPVPDDLDPGTAGQESRVIRLSHAQYANTVADLLGVDGDTASAFAPDSLNGFQFDTSSALQVDSRLGPQYRRTAEQLAEQVVNSAELLQRLLPCSADSAGCAEQFVDSFGQRAFRRPLTAAEADRFEQLFAEGPELVASGNDFADGVQLTVEAMLQSPQFLYRTETSEAEVVGGREPLDDWEIASRLSYFLYDSMPDEVLFESAQAGRLNTSADVQQAARRMLADPRAERKMVSFHEQAWQFEKIDSIAPDRNAYPEAPEDIVERVAAASRRFVEEVVANDGGLYELLNAPYAFVDSELAPLFGVEVDGPLQRVDFDPNERKGFLMQPGFLAANSYAVKPDPIHRGLFVLRNLLCQQIPDPPPGAQGTAPPETDEPIITNRDEVALLTSRDLCQGCHASINPPGFAFEGFDGVGQVRTQDNGVAVDTTGTMFLDGEQVDFSGPHDLVDALAQSSQAQACYATRWLEFARGRRLADADAPLRDSIASQELSIPEIVAEVVSAESFLSRDANEVSQ